jgi:hypothetical protein
MHIFYRASSNRSNGDGTRRILLRGRRFSVLRTPPRTCRLCGLSLRRSSRLARRGCPPRETWLSRATLARWRPTITSSSHVSACTTTRPRACRELSGTPSLPPSPFPQALRTCARSARSSTAASSGTRRRRPRSRRFVRDAGCSPPRGTRMDDCPAYSCARRRCRLSHYRTQELSILTERLSRINEDLARKMQGASWRRVTSFVREAQLQPTKPLPDA